MKLDPVGAARLREQDADAIPYRVVVAGRPDEVGSEKARALQAAAEPRGRRLLHELLRRLGAAALGRRPAAAGQVVDELERWQGAGIDGVNIINHVLPGSCTEVIEGLLPELRRRGMAQSEYAPGTFREKLFADVAGRPADGRLDDRHPAAAFRGAFRGAGNTRSG